VKKRKIALLTIIIAISLSGAGVIIKNNFIEKGGNKKSKPDFGRWRLARIEPSTEKEEAYHRILTLGYLKGYNPASKKGGVTKYNKDLAFDGLNFSISAHAPEATLMSMDGKILHTWRYLTASDIWPDAPKREAERSYWRRAHLYKNGDIVALYANCGLIKIDLNSNIIWSYNSPMKPHHDIEVTDDGTIYVLTRQRKIIPWIHKEHTVREDFITILSHEGSIIRHISLLKLLANSKYKRLLDDRINSPQLFDLSKGDILHTNTLEVFDGELAHKSHIFKKGNAIVSFLTIDTIAIVDIDSEEIIWALGSGLWRRQHQPTLLGNGNILIFDNFDSEDSSKVMEFEPFTQEIVWEYRGDSKNQFFSAFIGSNQRFPNGNTLITETDNGRAFEVTKEKKIVWEFTNPHRAGEQNELIASLVEVIRVDPTYFSFLNDR
jgi:hypothetical protein